MKTRLWSVGALALFVGCGQANLWGQTLPNAVSAQFFEPELIRGAAQAIGLTPEQRQSLDTVAARLMPPLETLRRDLRVETERLAATVKPERLDERMVLAQAQKMLRLEAEVKSADLVLLIEVKNLLTPEQQARLRQMGPVLSGLRAKTREAEALVAEWRRKGRDTSQFDRARDEVAVLVRQGKLGPAEALLDRIVARLKAVK